MNGGRYLDRGSSLPRTPWTCQPNPVFSRPDVTVARPSSARLLDVVLLAALGLGCGASATTPDPLDAGPSLDPVWTIEAPTWVDVQTSANVACALSNPGKVRCWGYDWDRDPFPEYPVPEGVRLRSISLSYGRLCGLTFEASIWCDGRQQILGGLPGSAGFQEVALGGGFGCAQRTSGLVGCLGSEIRPYMLPADGIYEAVSVVGNSGALLDTDGQASAFGEFAGADMAAPDGILFREVVAANYMACGIERETDLVHCWPQENTFDTPKDPVFRLFRGSGYSACAETKPDRAVKCWVPTGGRLGSIAQGIPGINEVPGGILFRSLSLAFTFGCGVTDDYELFCWGSSGPEWDLNPLLDNIPLIEDGEWLGR